MASSDKVLSGHTAALNELANRSTALVALETGPLIIMNITSILGNLLVCTVIIRSKDMQTMTNKLICNLAISDIAMALFCMPVTVAVIVNGEWIGNIRLCQANGYLMFSFGNLSLMTLALIAINRYFKVCRPKMHDRIFTNRNVIFFILLAWLLPSFSTVPPLIGWGVYQFFPEKGFCLFPFHESVSFTVFIEVLFIGTPLVAIHVCYYKVFSQVKKHQRMLCPEEESSEEMQTMKSELDITKVLASVVLGFVMCWTPVSIIDFYDMATGGMYLPRQLYLMNMYLIYASSTINPIIYGISNKQFQKEYKDLLCCRRRKNDIHVSTSRKDADLINIGIEGAAANSGCKEEP